MSKNCNKPKIGDTNGKWTVIEEIVTSHIDKKYPKRRYTSTKYKYKCDCGETRVEKPSFIRSKRHTQCYKCREKEIIAWERITEDFRDKKFNNWTVVGISRNDKHARLEWKCVCDCGQKKNIRDGRLKNQEFILCKQCNSHKKISAPLYGKIRQTAKMRNIEFKISAKEMWDIFEKQKEKCVFSGLVLNLTYKCKEMGNASLDRIDSEQGYTKENCQWIHKTINICKHSLTNDEWLTMCRTISNHCQNFIESDWTIRGSIANKVVGRKRREENIWGLDYSKVTLAR